jgi:hypothetical protein
MQPETSNLSLLGSGLIAILVSVLLGRTFSRKSGRKPIQWPFDVLAGLAGCAVVIICTGLLVGDVRDFPSVLDHQETWKSCLYFIWSHPLLMFLFGPVLGVGTSHLLQLFVRRRNPRVTSKASPRLALPGFILAHRREFYVVSAAAFTLTVLNAIAGLIYETVPKIALLILTLGAIALRATAERAADRSETVHRDWNAVPRTLRAALRTVDVISIIMLIGCGAAALALFLDHKTSWLGAENASPDSRFAASALRLAVSCTVAALYAREALFFRYGDLREVKVEALPTD